jgi:hypothetical protein
MAAKSYSWEEWGLLSCFRSLYWVGQPLLYNIWDGQACIYCTELKTTPSLLGWLTGIISWYLPLSYF